MMLNYKGIFEVTLEDVQFFHAKLSSVINLEHNKVNFLSGSNGVGKSCLFEYLKKQQKKLFKFDVFFISQSQLDCLPSMRGSDLIEILSKNFKDRFCLNRFLSIMSILDPKHQVLELEVSKLSGGQAQFIKLAMGLSIKSNFYFLDEPFNNIDEDKRESLRDCFMKMTAGFLIIDHFHSEWVDQDEHQKLGVNLKLDFNKKKPKKLSLSAKRHEL